MTATPSPSPTVGAEPLRLHEMLFEEYAFVHGLTAAQAADLRSRRLMPQDGNAESASGSDAPISDADGMRSYIDFVHTQGGDRSALCLSGGGIRSASYSLGILQGLARYGILDRIDYLSSVSGGGYIAGWLTAWIHRTYEAAKETQPLTATATGLSTPVAEVFAQLGDRRIFTVEPRDPVQAEPAAIQHLRAYGNYLAPRPGLTGLDLWTLVAAFIRNLLVMWSAVLPFLMGLLTIPMIYAASCAVPMDTGPTISAPYLLGLTFMGYIAYAVIESRRRALAQEQDNKIITDFVVLGSFLTGALVSARALATGFWFPWLGWEPLYVLPAGYAIAGAIGAVLWFRSRPIQRGRIALRPALVGMVAGLIAGGVIDVLVTGIAWAESFRLAYYSHLGSPGLIWATCTAPAVLVACSLGIMTHARLASAWEDDFDREWQARVGGALLLGAAIWMTLTALGLWLPSLITIAGGTVALWGGSGIGALLLLAQIAPRFLADRTQAARWRSTLQTVAGMLTLAVVSGYLAWLSLAGLPWICTHALATANWPPNVSLWQGWLRGSLEWFGWNTATPSTSLWMLWAFLWLGVGLAAGWRVDPNHFSLGNIYRLRLVRAWLGASNRQRERNRHSFIDFAEDDELPLTDVWPGRPASPERRRKLFPVINAALNAVASGSLRLQERKALPFTFTPRHCGCHHAEAPLGYRPTSDYAAQGAGRGGLSLGAAMAISGAAANPNMGFHSSPLITALLALMNLRLGWWLGNPGVEGAHTWRQAGPRSATLRWLMEAAGRTNATTPWVQISDGGHYENLGLYEMVRRRVKIILVSDAGCDPQRSHEDLAEALRRIRIDLGVPITFDADAFTSPSHAVLGRICYDDVDAIPDSVPEVDRNGILIYLKASLCGDEPVELRQYAAAHPKFPHDTTGDQFFTEAQLESYRLLGFHTIMAIAGERDGRRQPPPAKDQLGTFLEWVVQYNTHRRAAVKAPPR